MKASQLFNPAYLYQNRDRVVPYLEERWDRLRNSSRLNKFRDRHRGGRCFIIGNGPSLTIADLEKLKGEATFAANKIYLAFPDTGWRPTYYVLEDDHIISQHPEVIQVLSGSHTFVNFQWKHLFEGQPDVLWYRWTLLDENEFPQFSGDSFKGFYCGYMVTYISLQLAFFMGFARVYLLGVDFNYALAYKEGDPATTHASGDPKDHFVSGYFTPGETRYLPRLDKAEPAMRCAKDFYESHGRTIYNATRGGKLEVFERADLDEVLNSGR